MSYRACSPLRRRKPLRREAGPRSLNPERRRRLFEQQFGSKARTRFMQGGKRLSQCSHVKSRGAGGGPDDMIPQCHECHHELHQIGIKSFERKYSVDLGTLAASYAASWRELREAMEES